MTMQTTATELAARNRAPAFPTKVPTTAGRVTRFSPRRSN